MREQLKNTYWQMAEPIVAKLYDRITSDFLFGKGVCMNKLTLLLDLQFYLDIMAQQMEIDQNNNAIYDISYYTDMFGLVEIQKQLRCIGIDTAPLFSVYTQTNTSTGIGSMAIENNFVIS